MLEKYYYYKELMNEWLSSKKWFTKPLYFYYRIIPFNSRPYQLWYRFKCWGWKRYTTVKPRYLPHTWTDRCNLLPNMMFEILSDFIENECNPGIVDWYYEDDNYKGNKIKRGNKEIFVRDEMQELYDWWHNTYIPWEKNQPELDEWYKFDCEHVLKRWHEIDDAAYLEFNPVYDSEEAEKKSRELLDHHRAVEKKMERDLKRNLHRIINIVDYMWT